MPLTGLPTTNPQSMAQAQIPQLSDNTANVLETATQNRYTKENDHTALTSITTELSARAITEKETETSRSDIDDLISYVRDDYIYEIIEYDDVINLRDCVDNNGNTLTMIAVEVGNANIARLLLDLDCAHSIREKQIDYNNESTGIQKLLNIALANADYEIVDALISHMKKCVNSSIIRRDIKFDFSDPTLICRIIDSQMINEDKTRVLEKLSVVNGQKELSLMEKILFESIYPKLAEYIPTIDDQDLFKSLYEIFIQLEPDSKVLARNNASSNVELIQNARKANNILGGDSIVTSAMNRSQEINSTTSSANTTRLKHSEIVVKDGKIKGVQLEELKLRLTEALAKQEQLNTLMKRMYNSGENDNNRKLWKYYLEEEEKAEEMAGEIQLESNGQLIVFRTGTIDN